MSETEVVLARNRAGRRRRMDRTHGDTAIAREVEMKSRIKVGAVAAALVGVSRARGSALVAGRAGAERDRVGHQLDAGRRRSRPHRLLAAAGRGAHGLRHPVAGAHRARLPGRDATPWAARRSTSTRATCARSTWCRPASARAWC